MFGNRFLALIFAFLLSFEEASASSCQPLWTDKAFPIYSCRCPTSKSLKACESGANKLLSIANDGCDSFTYDRVTFGEKHQMRYYSKTRCIKVKSKETKQEAVPVIDPYEARPSGAIR